MGTLVQQHSTATSFSTTQTETFSPAVAGNVLIIVATTNENAGADNISTPAGWTLLGTFRQGTLDVNVAVFGKIAVGGETSQTVTASASQRLQTWFGEFSGYTLTLDGAASTAGTASLVNTGDTGTVTPSAGGRLYLGVVSVKNSNAQTEGGGFTAATVSNELGATSAQKVTLGVYYDLNRSAAAREQPTWSTISARYAGLGILLTPAVAPVADATITVNRASVLTPATLLEIHSYPIHDNQRGLPNGSSQQNSAALTSTINAMNAICRGIANPVGGPGGGGFHMMDPTPYGGYTVGAQVAGSTLNVDNGANFLATGNGIYSAKVFPGNNTIGDDFTFTGVTGNQLTGCAGLPASIPAGSVVLLFNLTNNGNTNTSDRPLLFDNQQSLSVKELFDAHTNSTQRTLTLAGASTWMNGQSTMLSPPRAAHCKAWAYAMAEICYQFAQNGTPITHVDVWIEYKGLNNTNPGSQGGTGTLQDGTTGVLLPTDAGVAATIDANYGAAGYEFVHYQYMYNALWDAIKNHPSSSVNTIKVMGAHNNVGATTVANNHKYPFGTFDGTLQASGFKNGTVVPSAFDRNRLCYFLDYATGVDGLTMDYSIIDYGDAANANEAYGHANWRNLQHIVRQIKSVLANRAGLSAAKRLAPIHFIEYYIDVNLARVAYQAPTNLGLTDLQQGYFEGSLLKTFLEERVSIAYRWAPMGDGGGTSATTDALWNKCSYFLTTQRNATNTARNASAIVGESSPPAVPGALLPAYYFAKAIADNFPPATTLYLTACDDSSGKIWAVASGTKTMVANGYATTKNIVVEGSTVAVLGYGFAVVNAAVGGGLVPGTFGSTGNSASTFTRAARRKATFATSTGTGGTTFSGNTHREATMTSVGSSTSSFTLTGGRQLVQSSSAPGFAQATMTETFNPTLAGSAMILVVATNENAGPDTVATPSGWINLAEFAPGGDVRIVVFGKVADGGETSVTVTSSVPGPAFQRIQTAFLEFAGVSLNVDAISTANTTSLVLTGDTGTATPSGSRRSFVGVVAVKDGEGAALTGDGLFRPITVTNEGGPVSIQKLTVGVWYDIDRSTPARTQPTWTARAARYAGLGLLLLPDDPTVDFSFTSSGDSLSTFSRSLIAGAREAIGSVPI